MTIQHRTIFFLLLLASTALYAQDPPGAKRLTNQMVHRSSVRSVCFSPDGQYALSGSEDKTLKLWEVSTGKEIKKWNLNYSPTNVSFNTDGSEVQVGTAAYFVTFPLTETVKVNPPVAQNSTTVAVKPPVTEPPTISIFSQIIWRSNPATVHEPAYSVEAAFVSNYPNSILASHIRVYMNGQLQASG